MCGAVSATHHAFGNTGVTRVGVFLSVADDGDSCKTIYVLLRHTALEALAALDHKLMLDAKFKDSSISVPPYRTLDRTCLLC